MRNPYSCSCSVLKRSSRPASPPERTSPGVEGDGDLVALAVVPHVGDVREPLLCGVDALAVEPRLRASPETVEDVGDLVAARLGDEPDVRLCELVAEVRHEVADRAQEPGRRRHDDRVGAHQLCDRVRVQRPGATVGDEREVAWVVPALDRDEPESAGHVLVHDRQDALRGLLDRFQTHSVGDRLHRGVSRFDVERHLTAEQAGRR